MQPQEHWPQLWSKASEGPLPRGSVPEPQHSTRSGIRTQAPLPKAAKKQQQYRSPPPALPGPWPWEAGHPHRSSSGLGLPSGPFSSAMSGTSSPGSGKAWEQSPLPSTSESISDGLIQDNRNRTPSLFGQLFAPEPPYPPSPTVAIPTTQHGIRAAPPSPAQRRPTLPGRPSGHPIRFPRCHPRATSISAADGLLPPSPDSTTDSLPGLGGPSSGFAQRWQGRRSRRAPFPTHPGRDGGTEIGTTCPCGGRRGGLGSRQTRR